MLKSRIFVSAAVFAAFVFGSLTVHPIAQAVESFAATTCTSGQSCIGGSNRSSGAGVLGTSANGTGVVGQTKFASTSLSKFASGVVGNDLSSKGKFDVGVWGKSVRGDAVLGSSTSGAGVTGTSSSSVGVAGSSQSNTGVYGVVTGGSNTPNGVFGQDNSANTNGAGVVGQSKVGSGVVAAALSSSNTTQALVAAAPNGANVFTGVGSGNYVVAQLDTNGNLTIAGLIATSGSCSNGCIRGRKMRSYGAAAATPTLEDTGEAQLRGGMAYVRLDPAFASAIDPRQGYFVLVTPEGDTRGLFVTQRTPAGFEVRENAGGRSAVPFAYRVVAHPYGVQASRLPFVETRSMPLAGRSQEAPAERQ